MQPRIDLWSTLMGAGAELSQSGRPDRSTQSFNAKIDGQLKVIPLIAYQTYSDWFVFSWSVDGNDGQSISHIAMEPEGTHIL